MRVYVGGPMRGYPNFNFGAFDQATEHLRKLGHIVFSPAERDRALGFDETKNSLDGFDVADAMCADFATITRVDAIALLPGWERSDGARAERFVAEKAGRAVFLYDPDGLIPAPAWDHELVDYQHRADTATDADIEVRVTDPETGGAKGQKLAQLGAVDPLALLEVAKVAGFGGVKYERYNFARGYDWSLSFDALMRHALAFWSGEDIDPESGLPHMAHAGWHCLALVCFLLRSRGTDDRFPT